MVECESSTAMLSEFVNFVLIDTWWNVNQLAEGGVLKKGQGFNRYIVWNDNKENIINIKGEKIK